MAAASATVGAAGLDSSDAAIHVGVGLAGIGRREASVALAAKPHAFASLDIVSDAVTACLGAHNGNDGGIVISGTGSNAFGMVGGRTVQVGGYGFPVSDEGSGAHLGLSAVRMALRAYDRRIAATPLLAELLQHFSDDTATIIDWMDRATATDYATFAPMIVRHAALEDAAASLLLRHAANGIAELANALIAHGVVRVALMGSLAPALEPHLPGDLRPHLVPPAADAIAGALMLAQVESLGGEVVDVEVSAKNKTNLDRLLEMIALQADILDLKTNSERPAEGTVIEAKLDRGRGPVATVLVQRGTLRVGDIIVAGAEMGRVRALISDQGDNIDEAGPSVPVEVLGFNGPPEAGDRLAVVENEARARQVTSYRAHQKRENAAASTTGMRGSLEQMMSQLKTVGRKEFPLIVKADVQGSLEAILGSLEKLGTEEVAARILHAGVGGISESDVTLAEGFNAAIIGFSVRANKEAAAAAKRNGIEIRYYNIIYDLVDDIKKAMSGLLAPTLRETMLGNAQILEIFNISKVGKVAGCRVTDGTVERGANVRLIRDNVVVHEGKLSTLKRFKDEVKEVQAGQECGMAFENYGDMRAGDVIECYRVETIQRSL